MRSQGCTDAYRVWFGALALAAGVLLVATAFRIDSVAAQEVFRGRVDLALFDVVVLDNDRRPIEGLTAADFIVEEGGARRPIETFAAVTLPGAGPRAAGPWSDAYPRDVVSNDTPDEGMLVAIMMDRTIMAGPQTMAARNIALAAVGQLGPNDLAAIVRNDGFADDGRTHGFTNDKARLRLSAEAPFTGFTNPPQMTPRGLVRNQPDLENSPSCVCGICVLEAITHVADVMRPVARRKLLLFIGSNLLLQVEGQSLAVSACDAILRPARERMLRSLDRANVTVHSVDPTGLETLAPGFDINNQSRPPSQAQNLRRQGNLRVLPDYTGGRAVLNTNAPHELVPALFTGSRSYYTLGISRPQGTSDTRPRDVRIRVNRRGVTLHSRRSYYAAESSAAQAPIRAPGERAIEAALPQKGIPLRLGLTPTFRADGAAQLTMRVGMDVTAADAAEFDVVTAVLDARGRVIGTQRQTVQKPAGGSAESSRLMEFGADLPVDPGSYEIRVGVSESAGERVFGYADVPALDEARYVMSGFVISPGGPGVHAPISTFATVRRTFERSQPLTALLQVDGVMRAMLYHRPSTFELLISRIGRFSMPFTRSTLRASTHPASRPSWWRFPRRNSRRVPICSRPSWTRNAGL